MSLRSARRAKNAADAVPVIEAGALHWQDRASLVFAPPVTKRPCVLVPSEKVLLVAVDLPLSSHRQRVEAVPFAVEGLLAQPLSAVHVVLGPPVAPKRFLAAIVDHETMAEWSALCAGAGLAEARLWPDVLTLPIPPSDSWAVLAKNGRVLVRQGDGSGFGIGFGGLETAWKLAGSPSITSFGDALDARFLPQAAAGLDCPIDLAAAGFDLRQGLYAGTSFANSGFLRRASSMLGVGALIVGALHIADTVTLSRLAAAREATARTMLSAVMPELSPQEDLAAAMARLAPKNAAARPGRFLPLLVRVGEALNPQSEGLTVQSMSYDVGDGELSLQVAAEDLAALQRVEAALTDSGMRATSGVATADNGAAEVRIVIRDDEAETGS